MNIDEKNTYVREQWINMTSDLKDRMLMSDHQHPLRKQVNNLGITYQQLQGLRGLKTMEIGCGKTHRLVKLFLANDILAEGIDPTAPEGIDFLIRREIGALYPMEKANIPRSEGTYHLVLAHKNPGLYAAAVAGYVFSDGSYLSLESDLHKARHIISEALRIMHPEGKFIYYPSVNYLESQIAKDLEKSGYEMMHQEIADKTEQIENLDMFQDPIPSALLEIINVAHENRKTRTVIQRRR